MEMNKTICQRIWSWKAFAKM